MKFADTTIDVSDIAQASLDISDRHRTSLFTWNGQFSPQFVEAMLSKYSKPGYITYDPFAGSGTVADESIRQSMGSYATELNPAAYHMSKFRELASLDTQSRRRLIQQIDEKLSSVDEPGIAEGLGRLYQQSSGDIALVIGLLVILCDFYKNAPSRELVSFKWDALKAAIMQLPNGTLEVKVVRGDARKVPFSTDTADIVLTSPPYINVMNYHQQYRRSVEILGYQVLSIAKSEFGSNRMNRGNRFLTVIEYAIDMGLSLKETSRVLKKGNRLIAVVGKESRVLGCAFSNSEIVWRVATEVLGMRHLMRQQRRFKNKYGRIITEDILHFENADCSGVSADEVIRRCRLIARDSLLKAQSESELSEERAALLAAAIAKYESVGAC